MGYVDSPPITTYNSVSRLKEPRAPWMAEHLAPTAGRGTLSCCGAGSTHCSCRGMTITQVMNAAAGFPPLVPTPRAVPGRQHTGAVALGGVGKARTIWWMRFSACHLPCAASKLCVVPRSPLSCASHTPIELSFIQALTWISPVPSNVAVLGLSSWGPASVRCSLMHRDFAH